VLSQSLYRARQFFRALLAGVQPKEHALVRSQLTTAQMTLFRHMPRSDQRHCLDVFWTLYNAGYRERSLLQAALLHDVGKTSKKLTLLHRVAVVLLHRFAPGWLDRLAADGKRWKAGFAVHARHAETGAAWAAQAGSAPRVVSLIRRHHTISCSDKHLAALQWADRQN